MAIYVSSGAFRVRTVPGVLEAATRLGVTHLELSSGLDPIADIEAVMPALLASGLDLLVHNYFPAPVVPFVLNLAALDEATLEHSRRHVRECLRLTGRLGGGYYSVHGGFALALKPELLGRPEAQAELARSQGMPDREAAFAVFVESLRLLCAEAKTIGKQILVENNVIAPKHLAIHPHNPLLICEAGEIERLFAAVAADNLGLLVDVAHARVSATALGFDPADFLRRLAPLTRAYHLSDNDGREDSNLPITESAWFWPHLAKGRDIVIEVYRLDDDAIRSQWALAHRILKP
ncbi:MAG: sugar phosphate isomerase/epimerase [Magnetospirillum sp.]|nr:sugar phosphate isomerase/epimerase [Magnetospirillum sp.]